MKGIAALRGVLSGGFFAFYGLFGLLAVPLVLPLCWWHRAVRFLVRSYWRLFVLLLRLSGLIGVEFRGPGAWPSAQIICMNHLTLIDVVVLMAYLPDSSCIVKGAVVRNPFMAAVARTAFIANDSDPVKTVAAVRRLLAKGVHLVIFPEGTRTPVGAAPKLRRGAAHLALATGAPIHCFHLKVEPPVLGKRQPFWQVADRRIRFRIEDRGTIIPRGEDSHRSAAALTETIYARIVR